MGDNKNEVLEMRLGEIEWDGSYQLRSSMSAEQVRRYALEYRNGDAMPPLKVAQLGERFILVDGFHRYEALQRLERETAKIEVEVVISEAEARNLAGLANLRHGLPMKRKDCRAAFRAYVKAGKHRKDGSFKSYRELANELGNTHGHTTIRNWMEKDFPSVFRAMKKGDEAEARPGASSQWSIVELNELGILFDKFRCVCLEEVPVGDLPTVANWLEGLVKEIKGRKGYREADF